MRRNGKKKKGGPKERKEKEGLAEGMVILPRNYGPERFVGMEDLKVLYIYQRIKLEERKKLSELTVL